MELSVESCVFPVTGVEFVELSDVEIAEASTLSDVEPQSTTHAHRLYSKQVSKCVHQWRRYTK